MRILNVTQTYAPFLEFGGPPVKVRALSEALARRGHQVTALTADWGLEARLGEKIAAKGTDRSPFGWRREENGVQAIYLPTWFRYRALSWNPAVHRFLRARLGHYDIVHIFGLYDFLGPTVAAECRRRGVPYVVEPIGMFLPIVRSFRLKRMYHGVLGRAMLGGARFLIATSEQELEELASPGGFPRERILLRRNGVDEPAALPGRGEFRSQQGIPPGVKLVLFLGRLSKKKSPDLLLHAFAKLPVQAEAGARAEVASPQLAFVGPDEGGTKGRLTQMARELGVASRVHFCGPLFGQAKWAAYRDSDVFVLPSQNENFGNTAAEAAVAGTPMVVTKGCGIAPLLAENGAALVVAHDADLISHAIRRGLHEPELRSRLAVGCREAVAKLGWEEPAAAMEILYGQLVGLNSRVA
jgi:glycosyltransferase involved in cell wall biosynthesis